MIQLVSIKPASSLKAPVIFARRVTDRAPRRRIAPQRGCRRTVCIRHQVPGSPDLLNGGQSVFGSVGVDLEASSRLHSPGGYVGGDLVPLWAFSMPGPTATR